VTVTGTPCLFMQAAKATKPADPLPPLVPAAGDWLVLGAVEVVGPRLATAGAFPPPPQPASATTTAARHDPSAGPCPLRDRTRVTSECPPLLKTRIASRRRPPRVGKQPALKQL
jgi:hypothetical protein